MFTVGVLFFPSLRSLVPGGDRMQGPEGSPGCQGGVCSVTLLILAMPAPAHRGPALAVGALPAEALGCLEEAAAVASPKE